MSSLKDSKSDVLSRNLDMANGKLYFASQDKGRMRLPKYSTTERDLVTDWENGEMIFNYTAQKVQIYANSVWETVTSA